MTKKQVNEIFISCVEDVLFDCFDANEEFRSDAFMYIAGADDLKNAIIKELDNNEH